MTRRHHAIPLHQAVHESPTFAHLAALARESGARLKALEHILPAALRKSIQPGPIEGTTWCLIVDSNAAAAKLRQVLPAVQAHLRTKGWEVATIRLKVKMTTPVQERSKRL